MHYQNDTFKSSYIGHNSNDPSGQKALEYESLFREQFLNLLKTSAVKVENPLALLQEIRKTVGQERNAL
jgi:hypothetical protein